MYYVGSSSGGPPIGRLAFAFLIIGVLTVVPALSLFFVVLVGLTGVLAGSSADDAAFAIWLGGWIAGNALWLFLSYRLDAWDEERCAQRRSSAQGSVILRWRNRLLVDGASSRTRLIAWCCLGLGIGIVLYPATVALCLCAAYGFASIEDAPNSVGPQPLIGLCFVVAALVLASIAVNRLWERSQLIRHGRLITGTVTFAGLHDAVGESPSLHVDYRFLTPAGEQQVGSEHLSYRLRRMPVPGEELVILYDERLGAQAM